MTNINKVLGVMFLFLLTSACTQSVTNQQNEIQPSVTTPLRATGDLGVVIERATSQVQIVNHSSNTMLSEIDGLGDLSHASIVYSRDQRFAYVFARDGGLTKIDMLKDKIAKRIIQSGNSIGGAISQDGKLIAVSNYTPGGVKVFNSETLELVATIDSSVLVNKPKNDDGSPVRSKVVGLVDAPGQKFVFSLFDSHEIWIADFSQDEMKLTKFEAIGLYPYDALISPDGRYYIAGLFGEDGLALLDLWHTEQGVRRILPGYGKGDEKLPVYKMPHLEGWAMAGDYAFLPAVGKHSVLVVDTKTWLQVAEIPAHSQPIFVMSQPDNRQIWVNFAFPDNNTIQVFNTETFDLVKTLTPGPAVLHMEFTPRGENVWISVRDSNEVHVYDTATQTLIDKLSVKSPSGIFFTNRAHQIGL
ncbi:cytochrome D1 domain-containing protein [Colwellia sp. M166]|uniref:cytochrome D1 domain-containing protein n=1 Tax=Colwellia sp. M166 TaxID=2583805 RepID=UPI0027BAFF3B|nr:cytochrome D1 domain-containing protein [Colwellia sp. M166]|tara:strand:+ start:7462 stop:8706 length:1245 start_codon:yes stop_codon:yes gene_type:complete